jgi:hypothetical protein
VNYNFFFFLKVVISSAAVVGSYRSYFIFYLTTLAFGSNESFCYVFLVSAYIRRKSKNRVHSKILMLQSISDTIFGATSSPSSPQSTNVNMSPRKRAQQAQSQQAQSSMQSSSASKTSSTRGIQ